MLDQTDKKLLNLLQTDATMTHKQLAAELNLTVTPVFERIKKLKKSGVIEAIQAKVNRQSIGKSVMVFCEVSVLSHSRENLSKFEKEIGKLKEVIECFHVSGNHDYILKVVESSMDNYREFLINKLSKIEGVGNVNSTFVMHELKQKNYFEL